MTLNLLQQDTHPARLRKFLRENFISDFEARRVMRPKFTIFWRYVCKSFMEALKRLAKSISVRDSGETGGSFQLLLLFSILDTLASEIEKIGVYTQRDPPNVYEPLPKIETGGCARSDLLARLLIS